MKNNFNLHHFLVLFTSALLIGLFQHDFIDKTYHSFLEKNPNLLKFRFTVNDTNFSKGRMGNIQEINLKDLVKFHGHACDGLILGALGLKEGLQVLYPDGIIDRTNNRVVSKSSPCLTDAAIYITGARYQYNTFYVNDNLDGLYIIQRMDNHKAVSVSLKEGVKPAEITRLGLLADQNKLAPCELDKLRELEDNFGNQLLNSDPSKIFIIQELDNFIWNPLLDNKFIKTDILNKNVVTCK